MKKLVDAERIRATFKTTQGIVKHEFEQRLIERIASEGRFEEEDAVLMIMMKCEL